jgi:hypothetical protein
LGPAATDISDLTMENLAVCSKHAHGGGLAQILAPILSPVRLSLSPKRIRGHGLLSYDPMFGVSGKDD